MSSRKKPRSKLGTKAAPAQPARAARRRWLIVGTSVLAVTAIAAVAVAILLRPSGGVASGVPWERLKTQDVHSLVFPGPDSSTVLSGITAESCGLQMGGAAGHRFQYVRTRWAWRRLATGQSSSRGI